MCRRRAGARLPDGLEAFVDHVVPLLLREGIFRAEYEGETLRDHLALRPVRGRLQEAVR